MAMQGLCALDLSSRLASIAHVVQVVLGLLIFTVQCVGYVDGNFTAAFHLGLWMGLVIAGAGVVGYLASTKNNRKIVVAALVLCTVSLMSAVTLFVMAVLGFVFFDDGMHGDHDYVISDVDLAVDATLIVLSGLEMMVSIAVIVLSARTLRSQPTDQVAMATVEPVVKEV